MVAAIFLFVFGLFAGPLSTGFLPQTPENWWMWPAMRVGLVLGWTGWFGFEVGRLIGRIGPAMLVALGFASLVSYAPILDLARGPLVVTGELVSLEKTQWGWGGSRSNRWYDIELRDIDGSAHHLRPSSISSDHWAGRLRDCDAEQRFLRVSALRHLDKILDVECLEGTLQ